MAASLFARIKKLTQQGFINYDASYSFSCDLESIINEIETFILPENSVLALNLIEEFLASADVVYQSVKT